MKLLISSQAVLVLLQLVTCGFSVSFLAALTARVMFTLKLFGVSVKLNTILVFEIISITSVIILPIVFGGNLSPLRIILTIVFSAISYTIVAVDDHLYIHTDEQVSG